MREFALSATNVTVSSNTLAAVHAAAAVSCNLEILRAWAGQAGSTTSAQQRIQHVNQVTAFPTLAATTPQPLKGNDQISRIVSSTNGAAGTAGTNATAEGAGAKTVIFEDVFNVLNGYLWVPTPRETIVNPAGSASSYGIYLPAAPSSLSNWDAGLIFAEV
jgi:hypothetical protein